MYYINECTVQEKILCQKYQENSMKTRKLEAALTGIAFELPLINVFHILGVRTVLLALLVHSKFFVRNSDGKYVM